MQHAYSTSVTEQDAGLRLDAFLAKKECYKSRSAAVKAIDGGLVLVNGIAQNKNYQLGPGDFVVYEQLSEIEAPPITGEPIPLDIRYEDDDLVVLSKQTGLCVHPSPGHFGSTLCHALVHHYGREGLAHIQGEDRPGIVHRLDMETSGLMLCAKTDDAGLELQDMIRLRNVDRRYLALVHGVVAHDTGMIDQPIARGWENRLRMVVSDRGNSRVALTTFTVLERFEPYAKDKGYTLLECKLYTGRTHQIRVHMEFIGHCCVGDPLYSWGQDSVQLGLAKRQFLHSYSLAFAHPSTGKDLHFTDGLPPDLLAAYQLVQDRSMGKTEDGQRVLEALENASRQNESIQL